MTWEQALFFIALILIVTVGAGAIVKKILNVVTQSYARPLAVPDDKWRAFVESFSYVSDGGSLSGWVLGSLERLLFFFAILSNAYLLIPGWMAVKVATKWQSWSGIFENVTVDGWPEVGQLHAQRYIRWRVSQRFLIGTILNILIAYLAARVAIEIISTKL